MLENTYKVPHLVVASASKMAEEKEDKMAPKRDSKGHMMAIWDEHPACRNCLRQLGIFCTRATPCSVCAKWDEATWQRLERAVQEKERRKLRLSLRR